nr:MAG TPA: hypothetical protein [Caudoviricetes sp.]
MFPKTNVLRTSSHVNTVFLPCYVTYMFPINIFSYYFTLLNVLCRLLSLLPLFSPP